LRTADANAARGLQPPIESGAAPAGQDAEQATANADAVKTEPLPEAAPSDDEPPTAT
jgi:hypothetical protein